MTETAPPSADDLGALRHRMADLLDIHPMQEWSAPLLLAVTSVVDATLTTTVTVGARVDARPCGRPTLRIVR